MFARLDMLSPRADDIYGRLVEMLASRDPATFPLGLKEQLDLQVDRFRPGDGSPECEITFIPGFFSFPSA